MRLIVAFFSSLLSSIARISHPDGAIYLQKKTYASHCHSSFSLVIRNVYLLLLFVFWEIHSFGKFIALLFQNCQVDIACEAHANAGSHLDTIIEIIKRDLALQQGVSRHRSRNSYLVPPLFGV